jgi:hypothetical protein
MELNPAARGLWAKTRLRVHPELFRLITLPTSELPRAAEIIRSIGSGFAALILESAEVSLTLPESIWLLHRSRFPAATEDGPFRAITLDLDVDLSTWGYFAPAAVRLAEAGVSIVPQCAFLKDHLLVKDGDLDRAVALLEALIRESQPGG